MKIGDRVKWVGIQDPRAAPGFHGVVERIAHHDEDSLRVLWDERGTYTWERRKNLAIDEDYEEGSGVLAKV